MLRPVDFQNLERQAAGFTTKNHHRFLSEALACLRQTRDPVAALELLARMQSSAHAERSNEAEALRDIVTWLRDQLRGATHLPPDALELRLAWARRIGRIATNTAKNQHREDHERPLRGGPGRPNHSRPAVTDQELRQLRQRYPQPPQPPPPPRPPGFRPTSEQAPEPAQEPQQSPLPEVLKVMFAHQQEATTFLKRLLKTSSQASAAARPARHLPLALQKDGPPIPPDLGPVFLVCTATTPGLAEYIKELNAKSGRAFDFYVTTLERDGDRLFAHQLLLAPPSPPSPSP